MEELKARMTQPEFNGWREFYKLYPFDDRHRFHRPAALIAKGQGIDMDDALNWLDPEPMNHGLSDADLRTMKALGYKRKGT